MNRQWRVLVVDDLEQWREQLVETLQGDGYYTDSASSAAEVLERLSETFITCCSLMCVWSMLTSAIRMA